MNYLGLNYFSTKFYSKRLYLRSLLPTDCAQWIKQRQKNYDYLREWEPVWDMDHLTYNGFSRTIRDCQSGFNDGIYYGFGIFEKETNLLVGHIEVANVLGWPKQSATVGYWVSMDKRGQGYMPEALQATMKWAFETLDLVKIEAGTIADNEASQRVLSKSGFLKEGYSKAYGEIDGIFKDHVLWGITVENSNIPYLT